MKKEGRKEGTWKFLPVAWLSLVMLVGTWGVLWESATCWADGPASSAGVEARVNRLARLLDLDDAQKDQVRSILINGERERKEIIERARGDGSMTARLLFGQLREVQQDTRHQIEMILTPEQRDRLNQVSMQHGLTGPFPPVVHSQGQ